MAKSTIKDTRSIADREAEKMEKPVEAAVETPVETPVEENVQDIEIGGAKRKRFRINHDNNKILELNTNDIGISYRLSEAYKRLNDIMDRVRAKLNDIPDSGELDDEQFDEVTAGLKELNDSMCKEIDFIFDAPVAEMCSDGGSMYDPSEGMFRYEHIIDKITSLYESSLNHEFTLMRQRANNRAKGYIDKKPKKATKKYSH